nr:MAG TPA: hypothetical protein [Caudoviricetes sp.]
MTGFGYIWRRDEARRRYVRPGPRRPPYGRLFSY